MLTMARAAGGGATPARSSRSTRDEIDLRDVEFVAAVARHGSFTRAASDLHIAQPALSATIQRLEANLGLRLFDRTTRRVALTDAGEAFVVRAGRIMSEFGRLSEEMSEFAAGVRGILRLSWWYRHDPWLTSFLRTFGTANPGIEIAISERSSDGAVQGIRSGEIAIAVIAMGASLPEAGLQHRVLRREGFALITAPGHRLSKAGGVRVDELRGEAFIATPTGSGLRACLDLVLDGRGRPEIAIETEDPASMIDFVSEGLGVSLVPRSLAPRSSVRVRTVPLDDAPPFELSAIWEEGNQGLAAQRAIELLVDSAKAESPSIEPVAAVRGRRG